MGRAAGRYQQLRRVLDIIEQLRGHRMGIAVTELAQHYGKTVRTISDDINAIEDAGFSIDRSLRDKRAVVRLLPTRKTVRGGEVFLADRERYTLLAVRSVFDVLRPTPFFEDVASMCDKLADSVSPAERGLLAALRTRFLYVPDAGRKRYAGKEDVLDALVDGVVRGLVVRCEYRGRGAREGRSRLIAPYTLVLHRSGLYVIARRLESIEQAASPTAPKEHPVLMAVERFASAEVVRKARFSTPDGYSPEALFAGAFGIFVTGSPERFHVAVEFDKDVREEVEARDWHSAQTLTPLKDGGVRVEFDAPSLNEVVPWVLSWGEHARAVGPEQLVSEVGSRLRTASEQYLATPSKMPGRSAR